MKTLLITTALLISATTASAFTCKNTVSSVNGKWVYTYSKCTGQPEGSPILLEELSYTANNPPKDNVEETVITLDGKYVTKTKFWGDPNSSDKSGDVRKEITEMVYDNGVLIKHRTVTKHRDDNGNKMKIVDNHLTKVSKRKRANGDWIPKDYVTKGLRTVAGTGNWVDTKPTNKKVIAK